MQQPKPARKTCFSISATKSSRIEKAGFFAILLALMGPLPIAQGGDAPLKRGGNVAEIGAPLYVLQQPDGASAAPATFYLWELRPPERDRQLLAGSKLLLKYKGALATVFGFAGFQMTHDEIHPGTFFFLDRLGKIRRAILEQDRNGSATVAPVEGEYTQLEEAAESTLFAIRKSRELVEIDQNGGIASVIAFESLRIRPEEAVVDLHRMPSGSVQLVTDQGRCIESSARGALIQIRQIPLDLIEGRIEQTRIVDNTAWIQTGSPAALIRYDFKAKQAHRLDLSKVFQGDRQGGRQFKFMGLTDGGNAYVRAGNHVYSIAVPMFGASLSYRIVADSFFAQGIRPYGIDYGLFTDVLSMQPRQAERDGTVRRDVEVRGVMLEEKPQERPAPVPARVEAASFEYRYADAPLFNDYLNGSAPRHGTPCETSLLGGGF